MENKLTTKFMNLNIQLFAEEGDTQEPKKEESTPATENKTEPKTFDEILSDKTYQGEFDKRLAKAQETAVAKAKEQWEKEQAQKVAESKKLADMDELQKKDYEIESLKKALAERDADKQASDLMNEAIKQANEKGIPISFMTALDYKKETAESINSKIEVYAKEVQNIKTNAIENYSKEPAPQVGNYKETSKDYKKMSYEELAKLPEFQ